MPIEALPANCCLTRRFFSPNQSVLVPLYISSASDTRGRSDNQRRRCPRSLLLACQLHGHRKRPYLGGICNGLLQESRPESTVEVDKTAMTGSCHRQHPARCAAPPAATITTLRPRATAGRDRASRAEHAEVTSISNGWKISPGRGGFFITGRSLSDPMSIPTIGYSRFDPSTESLKSL